LTAQEEVRMEQSIKNIEVTMELIQLSNIKSQVAINRKIVNI